MKYSGYVSNDFSHQFMARSLPLNFRKMIEALEEKTKTETEQITIALMVGESSLVACLYELYPHCDIILNVDINPLVLNLQKKRLELIQSYDSNFKEKDFFKALFDYLRDDLKSQQKQSSLDTRLLLSKYSLGKYWPFSSEQRLTQVKEAASRVHVVPVCLDLFCKDSQSTLAKILRDNEATVNTINLTNVFEYYPSRLLNMGVDVEAIHTKPSELFKDLPVSHDALVHCSRLLHHPRGSTLKRTEDNWLFLDQVFQSDLDREKKQ